MPTTRGSQQRRSTQRSDEEEVKNDTPTALPAAVAVTQLSTSYRDVDMNNTDNESDENESDQDSSEVVDRDSSAVEHREVVDSDASAVAYSNWSNYKNERKKFLAEMGKVAVQELENLNDLSLSIFDYEDAKIIALLSTGKLHSSDSQLTNNELFCN